MQNVFKYIIGLMSGTSLDGVDLVYVRFDKNYNFKILASETIPYSNEEKLSIHNAYKKYSQTTLKSFDKDYGRQLAIKINHFIFNNTIKKLDFIASHGHTVFHEPKKGITLQIGNGQKIADLTQHKVVCDFRAQDVALGGQGAPLVPIGDELLFSDFDYCLNLGGFANISFKKNNERIAFDVCPVNIVLNHYCIKLGLNYDDKGEIASKGTINTELLDKLNSLPFYKKQAPKSLGLEWVQQYVFPLIDKTETDIPIILRTFVEHSAIQIGKIIKGNLSVLVTGGGVFNSFLIKRIEYFSEVKINLPTKELINYKEALIFAFLGLLRIDNQVNCLKSVTGALKNHSSGKIFYPKKTQKT